LSIPFPSVIEGGTSLTLLQVNALQCDGFFPAYVIEVTHIAIRMTIFGGESAVRQCSSGVGHFSRPARFGVAHWVAAALLVCLMAQALCRTAWAVTDNLLELDIPAQSLATALDSFSRLTGMAILIDKPLTEGRRSAEVTGRHDVREALEMLLSGSGLMAAYSGKEGFTVLPAQVVGGTALLPVTTGAASNFSFATALQAAIERVLCRSTGARPGNYRAVLQLWIGPMGDVQHSRLISTTGDFQRDNALVQSLRLVIADRAPPSSMRQPVTILLEPNSAGKRMDCKQWEGTSR